MSLAYVILGLLQQENRSGYDLKISCFNGCINHLWTADQAQIYKTLDKLVAQDLITCTLEIQHDRPNRKVYSITELGKAELYQWLQSHQPLPVVREPLLVQLHFAAQLPDQTIIALLEQELHARSEKLRDCQAIALSPKDIMSSDRQQKMHQLLVDLVIRKEQTYIDWLKAALDSYRKN